MTVNKEYEYLVEKFGEEKISSRYEFLEDILQTFIKQNNYEDKIKISYDILDHIIIDYFVDIDRIKEFQEIEFTNKTKIYAYLSFWILRHKPLQILVDEETNDLVFVNEKCVKDFLLSFLLNAPANVPIISEKRDDIDEFVRTLEYYFRYREYNAKSIEIILLAFAAGRSYQYSVDYQK